MTRRRRNIQSIEARLRHRRLMRGSVFAVLIILAASAIFDRLGRSENRRDDWATFNQATCTVVSVVDGDTVHIQPSTGESTRVRLLGIDAPEMNYDTGQPPEYWAKEASEHLTRELKGKSVIVQLEATETRDKYDRLLAFLITPENNTNVSQTLIEQGHVYADRRFPHSMRKQFEQAESDARAAGRGLWRDVRDDQQPGWRQHWLKDR